MGKKERGSERKRGEEDEEGGRGKGDEDTMSHYNQVN